MSFKEEELADLKRTMSPQQIKHVAEIVEAEVKRREKMKSQNKSDQSDLAEMYGEIDEKMRQYRLQKDKSRSSLLRVFKFPKFTFSKFNLDQSTKNIVLLGAIVIFALLKIFSISSSENQSKTTNNSAPIADNQNINADLLVEKKPATSLTEQINNAPTQNRARLGNFNSTNPGEQQLLLELDDRRTELEKKAQNLEEKEAELKSQSQALAEKLAELKTLTSKIQQVRIEKDNQYEARLEQLSQVYGSIAPNEAAPMIAKLDEETALALLKRMPSKRMGQILSQMDPQRAVDLTKSLTAKDRLEDLPAK